MVKRVSKPIGVVMERSSCIYSLYYCSLLIIGITLFQIVYILTLIPDQKNDFHLPQVSLAIYQNGVCYSGIKIFNGLPKAIEDISSKPKKFKIALKHYLLTHSFYSLDEFFSKQ
jgi:hypothetical protein